MARKQIMKRLVAAAAFSVLFAGGTLAQAPAQPTEPQAGQSTVTTTSGPTETGAISHQQPVTVSQSDADPKTEAAAAGASETVTAPNSIETCIAEAVHLGSTAEAKPLNAETADRLDALFSKMETLCDGQQYADAMAVAGDIKTMIDAN